jgi:hypothetical protein
MADCVNDIAIMMDRITSKILESARQQDYHAIEASFHAHYVLKETRRLIDLRHRLNALTPPTGADT